MLFSGIIALPLWGVVVSALVLTHVTIAAVTIYLHRAQSHHALVLHPLPAHFFRFWLWLTTGMITRQWIAVHRKHHAKSDTPEDPHSPQVFGISRVLWAGMLLYSKEARNNETIERYGRGAPADWVERNVYSAFPGLGIIVLPFIDIAIFGVLPGLLVYGIQMAWIPFMAAGVINGIGHYYGYRSYACDDASTNIVPWGILIGGEELHNNHHAFVTSAKLSTKWYEIDIGWWYIRALCLCGLAKVRRVAPRPHLIPAKAVCDLATLHAIIIHRYEILMKYNRAMRRAIAENGASAAPRLEPNLPARLRDVDCAMPVSRHQERAGTRRDTLDSMRCELIALWESRTASREELLQQLRAWCRRAESSAIAPLQQFARELRCYA